MSVTTNDSSKQENRPLYLYAINRGILTIKATVPPMRLNATEIISDMMLNHVWEIPTTFSDAL